MIEISIISKTLIKNTKLLVFVNFNPRSELIQDLSNFKLCFCEKSKATQFSRYWAKEALEKFTWSNQMI